MKTRRVAGLALVAASITASAVVIGSGRAHADAPQEQGWWTVGNPGGLPANPASAIADVPADGLLVQAGPVNPTSPCGCTSYAGLVYELDSGASASQLVLKVAPNTATTPVATLDLCALVNPTLDAEQGGPLSDAPDYDCKHKVSAALDSGSSSFKFAIGPLMSDGTLAVAILPGDSTSRVVLSKPDSSSLEIAPSLSSTGSFDTSAPAGDTAAGSTGTGSTSTGATGGQAAVPSLPSQPVAAAAPDTGQSPVVAPSPAPASPAPLNAAPVASTSGTSDGSKPVAILLLLAGLLAGSALWAFAGHRPGEDLAEA